MTVKSSSAPPRVAGDVDGDGLAGLAGAEVERARGQTPPAKSAAFAGLPPLPVTAQ